MFRGRISNKPRSPCWTEKWAFFNVRHLMKEATGLNRGLCIIILNVHDIYRIPKEFRLDTDITILKNAPTNPFDEEFYTRRIGPGEVRWLHELEDKWVSDPLTKRFGVWYSQTKKGRLEVPFIESSNMQKLVWDDDPEWTAHLKPVLPLAQKPKPSLAHGLAQLIVGAMFLVFLILLIAAL